jgi:hypothetical protein
VAREHLRLPSMAALLPALALSAAALSTSPADAAGPPVPATAAAAVSHRLVLVAGGLGGADATSGALRGGGVVALRLTAIPRWLALELGGGALFHEGDVRVPVYVLLEKPLALTPRLELLPAVGPELVWARAGGSDHVDVGGRLACTLGYWPSEGVGLWVQPAFEVVLRDGLQEYALAVGAGVQVGFLPW